VLRIFDRIDIKKEKKVRETNDVCMREPEKLNIKRGERKTTLKKKSTRKTSKDENDRMICTVRKKMSS